MLIASKVNSKNHELKMTIGFLLDDTLDKPDGVQQSIITLGMELKNRGHEVHYIVPHTVRSDIDNIHSIGKYVNLKFNGNSVRTPLPISKSKIDELFNKIDFDVLHVQMPFSPLFAARILKNAPKNVRKVGTFHILPFNIFSKITTRILGLILRSSLENIDSFVAVSEPSLNFMRSNFKVSGQVIPNPVDYNYYSKFRSTITSKTIVYIGRFESRKGVFELAKAWQNLPLDVRKDHQLIMCGKGPLHDRVIDYSQKHNLSIKFPGYVSDDQKAEYLSKSKIAIFPSKSGESFGIVLIESMSAGSGITIGGNNPGYSSVLFDWKQALFDAKNPIAISDKIKELILDDKLRNEIGAKQKNSVKKYDVKKVVTELEKLYKGV